jgi:hypothetical protein
VEHWSSNSSEVHHPKTSGDPWQAPFPQKRVHNLVLYLPPGYERVPVREQAQSWQADETGVEHRLSRLPTLLDLQDVVHGLVGHVADALTTPGRRPRLVRWNWQREVNIVSCIVSRG